MGQRQRGIARDEVFRASVGRGYDGDGHRLPTGGGRECLLYDDFALLARAFAAEVRRAARLLVFLV